MSMSVSLFASLFSLSPSPLRLNEPTSTPMIPILGAKGSPSPTMSSTSLLWILEYTSSDSQIALSGSEVMSMTPPIAKIACLVSMLIWWDRSWKMRFLAKVVEVGDPRG